MSKYYSICHECRKIVCRSLSELGDDQQYCPSCKNKTDIVVDHPKLGNLDMLFFSIEAELVYFSTGRITSTLNGKFKIDLPLLRFKDNEEKHQSEIREMYNPDNIFKKRRLQEDVTINNEVAMVEYKEPLFRRFINKIKNIFHIR